MPDIINLTPHDIFLFGRVVIPKSENPARVKTEKEVVSSFIFENEKITVFKTKFGEVENLPEPEPDIIYIVSRIVKSAIPNRNDCLVPDDLIRDNDGNIIGCNSFSL